ncbi:MAG: sigma-70 family RNA polymerase sigma factor [Planctomycetota bacterium]
MIAQAVAGDGVAFGRLVQRHQDRLYNALLRFTGSAEDAQDAAQEAFVQAYVKLDRFRSDASFYTWLYRIAMNRAISAGRKRRERVSLDAAGLAGGAGAVGGRPVDGGGPVCDAPPDAGAIAAERVQSVHAAIARLAEDQRQVLVLRELEGMDYRQIAEVIGAPIGTVRSRLSRARAQLREALAPLELEGS